VTRFTLTTYLLFASNVSVAANVGPPAGGGQVVGEPVGIRHIRIVRENLTIDLRPASRNEKARVEATYQLHNDDLQQTLDLLFASGSDDVSGFEVLFDGQPVQARSVSGVTIPESWKPPKQTPGFGEGRKIDYAPGSRDFHAVKTVGFSLVVATGPHTLTDEGGHARSRDSGSGMTR
jgi:hypothetical protein